MKISTYLMNAFKKDLENSFRFAVFPKRYITFNPMQYVVMRGKKENVELFAEDSAEENPTPTITHEQYLDLLDYLRKKKYPAILPKSDSLLYGTSYRRSMRADVAGHQP